MLDIPECFSQFLLSFPQAQSYGIAKATDLSVANTALEQFWIWCVQSSSAEWLQLFASVVQDY